MQKHKNKKIVFLAPNLKISGGNRVFFFLAKELLSRGFLCEIIAANHTSKHLITKIEGKVPILQIGKVHKTNLGKVINYLKMIWFVRRKRKDCILIVSDPILCLFLRCFSNKYKYRFIQSDDYNLYNNHPLFKIKVLLKLYKYLTKLSYKFPCYYLFNSAFIYKTFIQSNNAPNLPLRLIHPAVDHHWFVNLHTRDKTKIVLCTVGRPQIIKGFIDFIKLWKSIKNSDLKNSISGVNIISCDDLSEYDLDMDNFNIIQASNDRELRDIYNKSHIMISTSRHEGFGMPGLEAMACGCALITSDSGGVDEYAEHLKNCIKYKAGDIKNLYQGFLDMLNGKLRAKLTKEGERTAKNFSWSKSTDKLLEYLIADGAISEK